MDRKEIKADAKSLIGGSNWILMSLAMIIGSFIVAIPIAIATTIMGALSLVVQKAAERGDPILVTASTILLVAYFVFYIIVCLGLYGCLFISMFWNALDVWYGNSPDLIKTAKCIKYTFAGAGMVWGLMWRMYIPIYGIIAPFRFAQQFFIKSDHPHMKAKFCRKASARIMKGYKMDYFIFTLSFFPWMLLMFVTCGLASFWVTPYMYVSMAGYYDCLKQANGGEVWS